MSTLTDVQDWYASNCDGDWEHGLGVRIETVDNPGWLLTVDLSSTTLEGKRFEPISVRDSDESWMECRVDGEQFRGSGDPTRLEEMLKIFVSWAKAQNEDWLTPPPPLSEQEQQEHDDRLLFDSLGEEAGPEICRKPACAHRRIQLSVMCRQHHFEMIRGRPAPSPRAT